MKTIVALIHKAFLGLALTILLFSCSKDESPDLPSGTDNGNSKPTINILKPKGRISPNGNAVDLKILFTDKVEMQSATIVMTAEALSNAPYYADTRQLDGTSDEISDLIPLNEVLSLGRHRITVSAINDNGKQEFIEQDFELYDEEDPAIDVLEFYVELDSTVTPAHSKFNFKTTDNYVLSSVKWFIYFTEANGNEIAEVYADDANLPPFISSFEYNEKLKPVHGKPGEYYKGVIEVEDLVGRKVRYDSPVMKFN